MDARTPLTAEHEGLIWDLADRYFADRQLRDAASPQQQIEAIQSILSEFDAIETAHIPDQTYTHQRLNLLGAALEILLAAPDAVDRSASLALAFATDAVARIPNRFAKNSPFGSACTEVWVLAHQSVYRLHPQRNPSWDAPFQQFEAAVRAMHQAPRTHAEGSLKSAKQHTELFAVGRSMPWMALIGEPAAQGRARPAPAGR